MGEKISLDNLAIMLEKPVQKVYITAYKAKAFVSDQHDNNIFVDLDKFRDYLDKVINEEIRVVNSKAILDVSKSYKKIKRGVEVKNHISKELLKEYDETCKELKEIAKRKHVDLSKITFVKK